MILNANNLILRSFYSQANLMSGIDISGQESSGAFSTIKRATEKLIGGELSIKRCHLIYLHKMISNSSHSFRLKLIKHG